MFAGDHAYEVGHFNSLSSMYSKYKLPCLCWIRDKKCMLDSWETNASLALLVVLCCREESLKQFNNNQFFVLQLDDCLKYEGFARSLSPLVISVKPISTQALKIKIGPYINPNWWYGGLKCEPSKNVDWNLKFSG